MMRTRRTVAAVLAVLALGLTGAPLVHADTSINSNQGELGRLYTAQDGRIYVSLKNRPLSAENCGAGQYYFVPASHPNRDNLFAALLKAFEIGQVVKLRVVDPHAAGTNREVAYAGMDR